MYKRQVYTIAAFPDRWATWTDEIEKKHAAGQEVGLELIEGRMILEEALDRAVGEDREVLETGITTAAGKGSQAAKVQHLLGEALTLVLSLIHISSRLSSFAAAGDHGIGGTRCCRFRAHGTAQRVGP